MTLSPDRARAYLAGALTGAFAALAVVALRDDDGLAAAVAGLGSLVAGAVAVALEERAQERADRGDA